MKKFVWQGSMLSSILGLTRLNSIQPQPKKVAFFAVVVVVVVLVIVVVFVVVGLVIGVVVVIFLRHKT